MRPIAVGIRIAMLFAVAIAVGCSSAAGAETDAQTDADTRARIQELFRTVVDLYQKGKVEEARLKAQELLELDPDAAADALRMTKPKRTTIEPRVIYHFGPREVDPDRVMRDEAYARKLVETAIDPLAHPVRRWDAIHKLQDAGQYTIPLLVDALGDDDHEKRALARVTATKMGPRAILPMIALLDCSGAGLDEEGGRRASRIREIAVLVLGDIEPRDARAIPVLRSVAEDECELATVRKYAARSLENITGSDVEALPPARECFYKEALRYLSRSDRVAAEALDADHLVWRLESGALVYDSMPLSAWPVAMAEWAWCELIRLHPTHEDAWRLHERIVCAAVLNGM